MKIVLCGSTRFKKNFDDINLLLSKRGHVVYSVAGFHHACDTISDEEKIILDLVHFQKIAHSDAIFVVGLTPVSGVTPMKPFVGESTRKEIAWATMLNRDIYTEAAGDHIHSPALQKCITVPEIARGMLDVFPTPQPEKVG